MNSQIKPSISFTIHLDLTEAEARALEALVSYDPTDFLKTFYEKLGSTYLKPHEEGYRALVKSVRALVKPQLNSIDEVWGKIKELR